MRVESSANDSPYWPACARDPGFLPWLHRILTIARSTSDDTPNHKLERIARNHGPVPPDWRVGALFMMHATSPSADSKRPNSLVTMTEQRHQLHHASHPARHLFRIQAVAHE